MMPARISTRINESDDADFFRALNHYKSLGMSYTATIKRAVIELYKTDEMQRQAFESYKKSVATSAHGGAQMHTKVTIIGGER